MTDVVVEHLAHKAAHAVALAQPMLGVPMTGDPVILERETYDPLFVRRACQYATVILQRDPQWLGDLSHLQAVYQPPSSVLFCSKLGRNPVVVATVNLPKHVMDFNPAARPLRLTG